MPRDPAKMSPAAILGEIQSHTRPTVEAVKAELGRRNLERAVRTAEDLERRLRRAVEAHPGHPALLRLTAAHDAAERAVAALEGLEVPEEQ